MADMEVVGILELAAHMADMVDMQEATAAWARILDSVTVTETATVVTEDMEQERWGQILKIQTVYATPSRQARNVCQFRCISNL